MNKLGISLMDIDVVPPINVELQQSIILNPMNILDKPSPAEQITDKHQEMINPVDQHNQVVKKCQSLY